MAVSVVVNFEEGAERNLAEGDGEGEPVAGEGAFQPKDVRDLSAESMTEYGSRVGVWRLLDIFNELRVPVTFFACGRALERNPDVGRAIAEEGHEACGHGYRWIESYVLSREEERDDISRCVAAIKEIVGERPLGWYARTAGPHTHELLVEEGGFLYSSDGGFNDDIPYFKNVGGTALLILPYSRDVNDVKYWRAPGFVVRRHFVEYARDAFDVLYQESENYPRMLSVGLHCRISGLPARAQAVADIIRYVQGFPGVWLARRVDIAQWWLQEADSPGDGTPTDSAGAIDSKND